MGVKTPLYFQLINEEDEEDEGDDEEEVAEIGEEAFTAASRPHARSTNYTEAEDILLVRAWAAVGWMQAPAPIKPVNGIGKGSRTTIVGSSRRIVGSSLALTGRFKAGGS